VYSATRKFGIEALRPDIRDLCDVYYPFKGSLGVDKTSRADAQDLICIFEEAFRQLQIDPREFKVVISHSQFTTPRMKELIMNVLFEHLGVQAVYMQDQSVFSMYSYHETTGIMVDIGDRVDIVPVVQGYVVESGVTRLPYGGKALTDHLMRLLTESGYRFFSEVESYITRYVKEQVMFVHVVYAYIGAYELLLKSCKVALNYETTISAVEANPQRYTAVVDVSHLGLPDKSQYSCSTVCSFEVFSLDINRVVSLNSGRFRSTEGLFQPRVLGKDNPGIHELVQKAVQACAMDTRKELYR
jgi:actin-related protein